jgi:NAD(P)-dependent dehydrogenase (short-subunit alcohol dehydrogenase family)
VSNDHLDELFGIQDKVTIIIGATGELGGAIAKGLRQAGAHVVLVGRNEATGAERAETLSDVADAGSARFISCDTTSKRQLKDLRERVDDHFGRLDVLVNSAGVNSDTPFLEIDEEEWNHIMEVNLKGVFLSCQVFGRYLIDQGDGGSIINISSMAGMTPLSRVFTYSAAKAGLINLSKNLAREWAPHDICVNCIAPGFFPADQNREILSEERIADIRDHTPMGRFGEANELIGTMLLLASDEASSFITGTNIPVDGGFSAMTI